MPRRSILSAAEREGLQALPESQDDLIRHYTFSEPDLSLIRQRRGDANRLGFAVQLCLLRYPGQALSVDASLTGAPLQWISRQLSIDPACWAQYSERAETRREHLLELRTYLGLTPFGLSHFRQTVHALTELALQTDKGVVLAGLALEGLRHKRIVVPSLDVIERICAEAITRANRRLYRALTEPLSKCVAPQGTSKPQLAGQFFLRGRVTRQRPRFQRGPHSQLSCIRGSEVKTSVVLDLADHDTTGTSPTAERCSPRHRARNATLSPA
jgi:hypothetical protein